jgi:hypothetical protein
MKKLNKKSEKKPEKEKTTDKILNTGISYYSCLKFDAIIQRTSPEKSSKSFYKVRLS